MNVLFVCRYNRYRSKVAEALFNKYKTKKRLKALSGGIQLDFVNPNVAESVKKVLAERKTEVSNEKSIQLDNAMIMWANLVVIVADDVESELFEKYKKKIERWEIPDENQENIQGIEKGIERIAIKVRSLITKLEKN